MPDPRTTRLRLAVAIALAGAFVAGIVWQVRRDRPRALLSSAREAQRAGDAERVREIADEILQLAPSSTEALQLRAGAAEHLEQWEAAAADYEQLAAVGGSPGAIAGAWLRAGQASMRAMRARDAERQLREAAQLAPDRAEPHRLLAQLYSIEGRSDEFVRELMRLVQLDQYTLDDLIVLGWQEPFIHDPERVTALLAADTQFRVPALAIARQAMVDRRWEDAEAALRDVLAAHAEHLESRALLGTVLLERGDESGLQRWLAELPAEADERPEVWRIRGAWHRRQRRNDVAVRCFREAFIRRPEHFATVNQLGLALGAVGEEQLSAEFFDYLAHARKAQDLASRIDTERIYRWAEPLVDELEAQGRIWEAWAWSRLVAQDQPQSPWAASRAAVLRAHLTSGAARTLEEALPGRGVDWARFPLPESTQPGRSREPGAVVRAEGGSGAFAFEAQGAEIGVDFQFHNGDDPATPGRRIVESAGAGVAALDYDRDGWPDLYFVQAGVWPPVESRAPLDALFRNRDGARFQAVTGTARIHEPSFGQGVASGDFDSDGFTDLYVANIGRNRLFRNQGDGTFEDVTDEAGLHSREWTISCLIADLDGDTGPDLFDVNYLQAGKAFEAICTDRDGRPHVCRPDIFPAAADVMAVSRGNGRFTEQSAEVGLDLPEGRGMGAVAADFDGTGRLSLFVANDMSANYWLHAAADAASGGFRWVDRSLPAGLALDQNGLSQACMGVACGDLNGDARPDLLVTNFAREANTLYVSLPDGSFLDETRAAGLFEPSFEPLGFGAEFLDADLDGQLDLLVLNGHIDDFAHLGQELHMRPQFFQGLGGIRFVEVQGPALGGYFSNRHLGRALAVLDWNRDGRPDAAVTHLDAPVALLTNRSAPAGRVLQLRLIGMDSPRVPFGARVRVRSGDQVQHVQLTAGNGYAASHERVLTVGLGGEVRIDELEVRWPGGDVQRFTNVPAGQALIIVERRPTWIVSHLLL